MSNTKTLTEKLLQAGAVPVPGKANMYELKGSPSDEVLAELLTIVRALAPITYLLPSDDPSDEAPEYTWEHPEPGTWQLPAEADSAGLLANVLRPGAWRIYVSEKTAPVEDAPDLFRGPTIAALDFLERYGVTAVIDAWHDNAEWRVAFLSGDT